MAYQKLTQKALKTYLNRLTKEELIQNIAELFKRFPAVKDYYQLKFHPEDQAQVASKYKDVIENEFFPSRGFGKARLSVAKKAISDYRKVCTSPADLVDMMLFYVEQGVKFTNAYGDIDEPFYNSMESVYADAVGHIFKHQIFGLFEKRCRKIVTDTSGIGWGFHDGLTEIYEEAFEP